MVDCHLHTSKSPDSTQDAEALILHAIEKGFTHICLTDHMELLSPHVESAAVSDLATYKKDYDKLKQKYADKIHICVGIECGFTTENKEANAKKLSETTLDYVINSIHEVCGSDCYFPYHFDNKTKEQSYGEYLDAVSDSLDVPYHFDAIAHFGYIERTAPYADKIFRYNDFSSKIDEILNKIIQKGKILELNTNVYGASCDFMPRTEIVERYYALGGRKVTFSSDAHTASRLGANYDKCVTVLKNIGFDGFTIVQNGKQILVNF